MSYQQLAATVVLVHGFCLQGTFTSFRSSALQGEKVHSIGADFFLLQQLVWDWCHRAARHGAFVKRLSAYFVHISVCCTLARASAISLGSAMRFIPSKGLAWIACRRHTWRHRRHTWHTIYLKHLKLEAAASPAPPPGPAVHHALPEPSVGSHLNRNPNALLHTGTWQL